MKKEQIHGGDIYRNPGVTDCLLYTSLPRIMIAAPGSGSGKTMLTCALLAAWKEEGLRLISYKCGPDYIDPMFHREMCIRDRV